MLSSTGETILAIVGGAIAVVIGSRYGATATSSTASRLSTTAACTATRSHRKVADSSGPGQVALFGAISSPSVSS
jgi:hypothetical protein